MASNTAFYITVNHVILSYGAVTAFTVLAANYVLAQNLMAVSYSSQLLMAHWIDTITNKSLHIICMSVR